MACYLRNSQKENKRLWGIYHGMKKRCLNKNDARYKDYGGRGIKICKEWLLSFDNFADWAKSNGYKDDLTIERIDVNGDYEPGNCKWITLKQQARNKRDTIRVTYRGVKKPLIEWCEELGLDYDTIHDRIFARNWKVEKAFETLSQRENSFSSLCMAHNLNPATVYDRIHKFGWSLEEALNTPSLGRGANSKSYRAEQFGYRTCAICGKEFLRNSMKQIYCGAKCRGVSKRRSYRKTGLVFDGRKVPHAIQGGECDYD